MNSTILLLCGLPASGKSSFCRCFIEQFSSTKLISFDDVESELVGEKKEEAEISDTSSENSAFYLEIWRKSREICKVIVQQELAKVDKEFDWILCDDNFYYSSMRKKYYHLAQSGV